jgi:hypothetical protein
MKPAKLLIQFSAEVKHFNPQNQITLISSIRANLVKIMSLLVEYKLYKIRRFNSPTVWDDVFDDYETNLGGDDSKSYTSQPIIYYHKIANMLKCPFLYKDDVCYMLDAILMDLRGGNSVILQDIDLYLFDTGEVIDTSNTKVELGYHKYCNITDTHYHICGIQITTGDRVLEVPVDNIGTLKDYREYKLKNIL